MATIKPRTLKGFRDFLPEQALERQRVLRTITDVYASFGYSPLETPALEYADVLLGKYGDEGEKLLYRFADQGDRDVALRYDLTVPLARVVAQYGTLPRPFRRFQIAPVWRAENTQKGRFREFTQCDIDVVGSASMVADAEVAQIIAAVLTGLGVKGFVVRLNNRKLLNGILEAASVPEAQWLIVLRILDKWNKIGRDGVAQELNGAIPSSTNDLLALLPEAEEPFGVWRDRVATTVLATKNGKEGDQELRDVMSILAAQQNAGAYRIDPLLARGLDYYTGTIIEAVLTEKPDIGSILGGGRYDTLIGLFTGKNVPAVGASFGLDRLMTAMDELGLLVARQSSTDVLVTLMDPALLAETSAIANELRECGIDTELYLEPAKLDKQLKYADALGIPYAVLYGSDEQQREEITVKDLRKGTQERFPRGTCSRELRELVRTQRPLDQYFRERFLRGQ